MLFIVVLFHLSLYKNFKVFYLYGIGGQYRACFDALPLYDRFVSLMPRLFVSLMVLLYGLSGERTGVYFVNSTKLAAARFAASTAIRSSMAWRRRQDQHGMVFRPQAALRDQPQRPDHGAEDHPGNTVESTVLDAITCHLAGKLDATRATSAANCSTNSGGVAYTSSPASGAT